MFEPRVLVRDLRRYHPPLGNRAGLHLDFNENTAGCSPRVLAALRELTPETFATYPERAPGEQIVARHFGLNPAQVLLSNGVDEAVHLIAETYLEPGDEVIIPIPTFSMYEIYAQATGAKILRIPADSNFKFPAERILAAITRNTKLIIVANPNNPTGSIAAPDSLLSILERAPQAGLLVDEAYFDFCGQTILPKIESFPNLLVARTFSKAYGMAGIRLGFVAADAKQAELLRKVSSPYNVNAVALACLPDALADQTFVQDYVREVSRGRADLQALLAELAIEYWPSQANFVLLRFGAERLILIEEMRKRGILVRDRNSDPGCEGCVRISLGTAPQNEQLLATLREVVALLRDRKLTTTEDNS